MTGLGVPLVASLTDMTDVGRLYSDAPEGLRANMIFSADGAAAIDGRVKGLTCAADQYLLRHLRGYSDAVLVGGATVRAENYGPIRLSADQREERAAAGLQEPRLAIVTLSGVLPESLHSPIDEPLVLLTSRTAAERNGLRDAFSRQVLVAGEDRVEIATALELLRRAGMSRILCEGGPMLLDEIVRAGLLDELCVTIAPKLGGRQPLSPIATPAMSVPLGLRLRHAVVHDGYLFLRYSRC